jgi:hypothetical protein
MPRTKWTHVWTFAACFHLPTRDATGLLDDEGALDGLAPAWEGDVVVGSEPVEEQAAALRMTTVRPMSRRDDVRITVLSESDRSPEREDTPHGAGTFQGLGSRSRVTPGTIALTRSSEKRPGDARQPRIE